MRLLRMLGLPLLVGCANTPGLCSDCPPIEGHYQMLYQPYDGGLDLSEDCATLTPPLGPTAFDLTRSGAHLRATINGVSCQGQLFETWDFSLHGTEELGGDAGTVRQLSLRGYFVAETADAGAQIIARWITRTEQGAKACDAEQRCTGTKK